MNSSREREDDAEASDATTALSVSTALMEHTLGLVRRYPVAALAATGGVGWVLYMLSLRGRRRNDRRVELLEEESVPILNTGHARIYDPDTSPRHPTQDLLETRREMSARA
jgi:hypothetical protein